MTDNAFLSAIYAAARRELIKAREAEESALACLIGWYSGGDVGKRARRLLPMYHQKRHEHLCRALRHRRNASEFRQMFCGTSCAAKANIGNLMGGA